ncbi:MAG: glycogen/starch/alpha-glucan phosphorylase [Pseudomonadota bacterium]
MASGPGGIAKAGRCALKRWPRPGRGGWLSAGLPGDRQKRAKRRPRRSGAPVCREVPAKSSPSFRVSRYLFQGIGDIAVAPPAHSVWQPKSIYGAAGDYVRAVEQKMSSETISKVLYPPDSNDEGKELRLIQEYFFVACAIRDVLRRFEAQTGDFQLLPEKVCIQLNDTHPALGVAELMRCLVDERDIPWDAAWSITEKTFGYTNHTLLPEALERWPVPLFERVLPRHLQIIYEVNQRFLQHVTEISTTSTPNLSDLSIIEEGPTKHVRMANLAIVGSRAVNGVAALHSELVKSSLVPHFHQIMPEKFSNKTNGITPRRWLRVCNRGLSDLITDAIGSGWVTDLDQLRQLESRAGDGGFREAFHNVKQDNKRRLAEIVEKTCRVSVDPLSIFDVQAKRIHEYKRQLLNVLNIVDQYLRITRDGWTPAVPKTYIFAGKAAPGYWRAKEIIKLINSVGDVVNNDPKAKDHLRVVFIPDYRVSVAERIVPACDLSEQISTAGKEASGTGNMKFALNGALTIGTLDGANIEIGEEVGSDNIFIFGRTAEEIDTMRSQGYNPWEFYESSHTVRRVLDAIRSDTFSPGSPGRFEWVFHALLYQGDEYFLLADLDSYVNCQDRSSEEYSNRESWVSKAIINVANMGKFSSDRTIREYANEIWGIQGHPESIDSHSRGHVETVTH